MKKVLVISASATDFLNDTRKNYLKEVKSADTEIEVVSIKTGPSSIRSFYDKAFSLPEVLKIVDKCKSKFDAIVINCFSDPALYGAREITNIPVVGPGEASMMIALMLGHKFGVVQTSKNYEPWIELQARSIGIEKRLVGVAGIDDIPFLELTKDLKKTAGFLVNAARYLIESKGAEVIILGCTRMAPAAKLIKEELKVPVIEPLATAFKVAELMIDLKLTHSKIGLYMTRQKTASVDNLRVSPFLTEKK